MKIAKLFTYLLMVFLLTSTVFAEKNNTFILSEDQTQNLYLTNNKIVTEANLRGDLYAISNEIKIKSLVNEDIDAITNSFNLQGTIGGDLRLIASETLIDGTVFGEVMILGSQVILTNNSVIGGPVHLKANTVIIDGTLKDDLFIDANKVIINGVIEGNVIIKSSIVQLGPDAKILGDFSSTRSVDEVSSKVGGIVTKIEGKDDPSNFTSISLSKLALFAMIFLIGAALILFAKKRTERITKIMYSKFLLSMLIGFAFLIVAPIVAILLLITVIGAPISVLIVAIYIMLLILGLGYIAFFLGRLNGKMAKSKLNPWLEVLIGALALALISIIPIIFLLVVAFIGFVSIGSILLVAFNKDKKK
ncbi:MAG: hypothetical protein WC758_02740 [Candidatus Woesearchaeota archaeon]|jgi:cytoskeletal protein CcmA (bactofilin family)